ncbi:TRAP transporter small permease [Thermoanaerobacterium sp. DL9XJH110]|uniref:TRAP transporter small permease n=1 Tax=Thermoanaerobacterium sp. DL9XJH110 TaxID=3386643 RepID=UPI003BB5CD1B
MSLASLFQVIFRYVLKQPLPWSEELARFLFVWVVFLGSAVAVKEKAHVGLEYFVDKLGMSQKKLVYGIAYILCIGMSIVIFINGWNIVKSTFSQLSPAMQIPMAYVYFAIPLGFLISAFNFLYLFINMFKPIEK